MKIIKLYDEFNIINESIKDSTFDSLLKKVKELSNKLNVGENKSIVDVEYGSEYGDKYISVKYTSPHWEHLYNNSTNDDDIQKLIDQRTNHIIRLFKPLEDFFQTGMQGFKDTFSKGVKTVDVSVSGFIKKIQSESNPDDFYGKRYKEPIFNVVSYSNGSKKGIIYTKDEYISKYGSDDLNIYNAYVYIKPRIIK